MNTKRNLKYQSTHDAILHTVLEMLEEKDIGEITVADVCRRVEINRSTFYKHFQDIPDVLEKMVESVNANFIGIIPESAPVRENFLCLFRHVWENRAFYSLLLRRELPSSVQSALFPIKLPAADSEMAARLQLSPEQLTYHHAMFQAVLKGLLLCWLERGCAETPEELYEILRKECSRGVGETFC